VFDNGLQGATTRNGLSCAKLDRLVLVSTFLRVFCEYSREIFFNLLIQGPEISFHGLGLYKDLKPEKCLKGNAWY
jgi:hypothetical protein